MGLLKNPKFTSWVIAILVILNLLTLGALVKFNLRSDFTGERRHSRGDGDRDPITSIFSRRLNFTEEQRLQFSELRKNHYSAIRSVDQALEEKRKQLFALHKSDNSEEELNELTLEIGTLFAEKEKMTFGHFAEMRAICTPEQLEAFDKLIQRLGQSRRRGGPSGRDDRDRGRDRDRRRPGPEGDRD